jgi:peptidyl-prolyl cis-trans isomerase B (cyclophilin B)
MKKLHTVAAIAALALTLAGCVARENASDEPSGDGFTPSATTEPAETESEAESESGSGTSTEGDCKFTAEGSGEPAVGLPPDEGPVDATSLALATSAGPITIQFDAERAPCTVQSIAFLASEGFYDNTSCHRMTSSESLKVLQCGDPDGTGGGGPGYTIPDELPTDLPAGPTGPDGTPTSIYQRGVVAMANAGPNTGGSQFFLVYGDSTLAPNYTVFGTMDAAGLATLDQIAAGGITPGERGEQDGAPATPVTIETATVS